MSCLHLKHLIVSNTYKITKLADYPKKLSWTAAVSCCRCTKLIVMTSGRGSREDM